MKNVMLVTGQRMASVLNEAHKIRNVFYGRGIPCDLYFFNVHHHSKTKASRYNLAIWWTPLLPMFLSPQRYWLFKQKQDIAVSYYTIEGIVKGLDAHKSWLSWQYIVTPSNFVKSLIEEMGFRVREVIPHQIPSEFPIDHEYGKAWRNRFPSNKKVLLYNGSQIVRKALPKLKQAIDLLSTSRNDFVMVYHTDKVREPFHTRVEELAGSNSIVETDFPHITIDQAYAKMLYSDIIVHPAITEGFGLPVAEALAMGKPLVCINAYGVNEIASPKNSFMVMNIKPQILPDFYYVKFKVCDYEPRDLAYQIGLALDSSKETLEEKRLVGLETVKRFHNSYDRFVEFVGSP